MIISETANFDVLYVTRQIKQDSLQLQYFDPHKYVWSPGTLTRPYGSQCHRNIVAIPQSSYRGYTRTIIVLVYTLPTSSMLDLGEWEKAEKWKGTTGDRGMGRDKGREGCGKSK